MPDELVVGARRAGDHEHAARVAVEAVHDAGTRLVTDVRDLRVVREQAVDERAVGVPRARVHDEARRLGDHEHVVVLVAHVRDDRRIGLRQTGDGRLSEELDHLAGLEPPALGHRLAVDEHGAVRHQLLDLAPRPAGEQGHRPVDALPRQRRGDRELLIHPWTLRRSSLRRGARRASERNDHTTTRIAPIVMELSATLKVGHEPMWTKSTTAPAEEPGRSEDAVDQVPERAGEHERERDDEERVAGPANGADEEERHDHGDDREHGRERLEQAERPAGVAGEAEARRCRR